MQFAPRSLLFVLAAAVAVGGVHAVQAKDQTHLKVKRGKELFPGLTPEVRFAKALVVSANGTEHRLVALGSGVRKKLMFKLYEGAAYTEEGADLGSNPFSGLIEGVFAKRIEMRFLREVDAQTVREAYEIGLRKVLGGKEWPADLRKDVESVLSYFPTGGFAEGESVELTWIPGTGLFLEIAGKEHPPITNPRMATAFWAIWFGPNPVSTDLKRDLIRLHAAGDR